MRCWQESWNTWAQAHKLVASLLTSVFITASVGQWVLDMTAGPTGWWHVASVACHMVFFVLLLAWYVSIWRAWRRRTRD